jgi:hypothetical protein
MWRDGRGFGLELMSRINRSPDAKCVPPAQCLRSLAQLIETRTTSRRLSRSRPQMELTRSSWLHWTMLVLLLCQADPRTLSWDITTSSFAVKGPENKFAFFAMNLTRSYFTVRSFNDNVRRNGWYVPGRKTIDAETTASS